MHICKMRKLFVLTTLLFCLCIANAQTINLPRSLRSASKNSSTSNTDRNRPTFFFAGNINSNFGAQLALDIEGGIYAKDWLRFAVGPRYDLTYDAYLGKAQHGVGATAYAEFIIVNYLVGHIGYEFLNYGSYLMEEDETPILDDHNNVIPCRRNTHALALGIGFQTHISEMVGLYAQYIIYPVQSKNYHYSNFLPMFARIGVTIDL